MIGREIECDDCHRRFSVFAEDEKDIRTTIEGILSDHMDNDNCPQEVIEEISYEQDTPYDE